MCGTTTTTNNNNNSSSNYIHKHEAHKQVAGVPFHRNCCYLCHFCLLTWLKMPKLKGPIRVGPQILSNSEMLSPSPFKVQRCNIFVFQCRMITWWGFAKALLKCFNDPDVVTNKRTAVLKNSLKLHMPVSVVTWLCWMNIQKGIVGSHKWCKVDV